MRYWMRICPWCAVAVFGACDRGASSGAPKDEMHSGMAAAAGVTRADGGKESREHRVIPLRPMSGDETTFRFARGQRIASARGSGRIVEGYGSGKIVQYEIEPPTGGRFMVNEDEVRVE